MLEPSTCAVYPLSRLIKRPRNAGNNIKTLALMGVYGRCCRSRTTSRASRLRGTMPARPRTRDRGQNGNFALR
jgi:hypothetical protein